MSADTGSACRLPAGTPALSGLRQPGRRRTLAGLFWARIEALAPGIDTLQLPPEVARAWKEQLRTIKRTTTNIAGERVEVSTPRLNAKDELIRVRALYLDIAHWAVEDPARWGPWVAPCPISDAEVQKAKERKHRKARMDQRTRERLPVLPMLVRTANDRRLATRPLAHPSPQCRRSPRPAVVPSAPGAVRSRCKARPGLPIEGACARESAALIDAHRHVSRARVDQ